MKPGTVAEIRIPNAPRAGTISGYFNDREKAAALAAKRSGTAPGVYFTLNPVKPDLLARANNRLVERVKNATSDDDVIRRCWLFVDFDPKRPAGISSTEAEHKAALERARQCRDYLSGAGWPAPVEGDSGNGSHLLYAIDLENDRAAKSLLECCLKALAFQFSDESVVVDCETANAARTCRLYGTLNCKGDNMPDRPHRLSRILSVPERIVNVPVDLLEALTAQTPEPPKSQSYASGNGQPFDLDRWIEEHGLPVVNEGPWKGGHKWVLNPCPWNPDHNNRAAFIVRQASGAIGAGCLHSSCAGNDWHALRDLFEPGWRDRKSKGAHGGAEGERASGKHSDNDLPRSLEAEQALLGSMLRENNVIEHVRRMVLEQDFSSGAHAMIFRGVVDLHVQGCSVDTVILFELLKERKQVEHVPHSLVQEVYNATPTADNVEYFARIVREKALARQLILRGEKLAGDVRDGIVPPRELWEAARNEIDSLAVDGRRAVQRFPAAVPCSELQAAAEGGDWLWEGYIARSAVTLLSALWKAGKTTLLSHLLKSFGSGADFCGLNTAQARVLYVTEENQALWAGRRDEIGLGDWCRFLIRPFKAKPRMAEWLDLILHIQDTLSDWPADLVTLDTLSMWPVREENNAGEVMEALTPLHQITETYSAAMLLAHHLNKADGTEARGSRGSGAICAFADVIIELRRYATGERADRRRVLTAYSRWTHTPPELVVELSPDATDYRCHGDRQEVATKELRQTIIGLLPCEPPGKSEEEITSNWPGSKPRRDRLLAELRAGVDRGDWRREGEGKKGDPYTFWTRAPG